MACVLRGWQQRLAGPEMSAWRMPWPMGPMQSHGLRHGLQELWRASTLTWRLRCVSIILISCRISLVQGPHGKDCF